MHGSCCFSVRIRNAKQWWGVFVDRVDGRHWTRRARSQVLALHQAFTCTRMNFAYMHLGVLRMCVRHPHLLSQACVMNKSMIFMLRRRSASHSLHTPSPAPPAWRNVCRDGRCCLFAWRRLSTSCCIPFFENLLNLIHHVYCSLCNL